ncbi:MAG: transglycosylase SLT domain-containing protein [Acidobacteriota bacterium]|nr:transglycosylase SLT domain-containing protein [Acidobacteriota bacterium]
MSREHDPRHAGFRRVALRVGIAAAILAMGLASCVVWRSAARDREEHALVLSIIEARASSLVDPDRRRLADALGSTSRDHGVDSLLLLSVIEQESHFDPSARGPRGGLGLMQVTPLTARHVAARLEIEQPVAAELFEPTVNVRLGGAYLSELKSRFGTWELALAAYNEGPTRVARQVALGRTPSSEYAESILRRWREHTRGLDGEN